MQPKIFSLLVALALGSPVFSTSVADKVAELKLAATAVDRIKLLPNDTDFVFDFLHPSGGVTTGAGGHSVTASSGTFPALIGTGMAMTIGFLGPCGYNTPHTHPRATEFNFAVNGTLSTGVLTENGARFIFNKVHPGSAAIFPKGAIHFEMNNECEPAMFVAAFNDEDPGVLQIAQRFFGIAPSFLAAALGGDIGIQEIQGLESKIPDNIALGTEECLKRCGIWDTHQPTAQRQPRVSANAFPESWDQPSTSWNEHWESSTPSYDHWGSPSTPSTYDHWSSSSPTYEHWSSPTPDHWSSSSPTYDHWSSPSTPSPWVSPSYKPSSSWDHYSSSTPTPYYPPSSSESWKYPPSSSSYTPSSSYSSRYPAASGQEALNVKGGASVGNDDGSKPNALVIALLVIVIVMLLGYLVIAATWFVRRRRESNKRTGGNKYFKTGEQFAPQFEKSLTHADPYDPPAM